MLFYVFFVLLYVFCVVLCIVCFVLFIVCFVTYSVLFVCICVLNYCHRVTTQLQLNISYHISYHINARTGGWLNTRTALNTKLNPRKFRQVDGLQTWIVVCNPLNSYDFVTTVGPGLPFTEAVSHVTRWKRSRDVSNDF